MFVQYGFFLFDTDQAKIYSVVTANTRSRILVTAHQEDAKTISGEPFL
jgi:hypothetical protein